MVRCRQTTILLAREGSFCVTSLMVFSRRDWLARSDQFEDAATQASGNLYRRLAETHLLN